MTVGLIIIGGLFSFIMIKLFSFKKKAIAEPHKIRGIECNGEKEAVH